MSDDADWGWSSGSLPTRSRHLAGVLPNSIDAGRSGFSRAAHRGQQIALFLIALAGHKDILRPAKEVIKRHAAAAQFALDQCKFKMAKPRAADLLRKVTGVKPKIEGFLFDLLGNIGRHSAAALNRIFMRVDFVFHKTADRIDDHLLFIG